MSSITAGQRPARPAARTRLPALPPVIPRGQLEQGQRVAAGLGDDPVPDPLIQPPGMTEASSARASASASPSSTSPGRPSQVAAPGRDHGCRTAGRPIRRPAGGPRTPAPAPRPGPATAHHRPGTAAAGPRPPPTTSPAPPGRPGNDPARRPDRSPNATPKASRCGPGSRSSATQHPAAQLMQRRERQLHLRLDALTRAPPGNPVPSRPHNPAARSCRYPPRPVSPATRLRPARTSASSPSSAVHCCLRPHSITRRPLSGGSPAIVEPAPAQHTPQDLVRTPGCLG